MPHAEPKTGAAPFEWPRNLRENAAARRRLLAACEGDWNRREIIRAARMWCATDPAWFIDGFAWTYDLRHHADPTGSLIRVPFILWDYQRAALARIVSAIEEGRDLLIDKSRDMGVTWLVEAAFFWFWLFRKDTPLLLVSRKEDLVDKAGSPDALFWKMDYMLAGLPRWLIPRFHRTHMHLLNRDNGSVIDGEATGDNIGRGGRRRAGLFDEWAAMENAERVLAASADAMPCRIFNSTPLGVGTMHSKMRRSGKIEVIVFHWSQHPVKRRGLYTSTKDGKIEILDKDYEFPPGYKFVVGAAGKPRSVWYDFEDARRVSKREMAQEIDIDHVSSGAVFFDSDVLNRIAANDVCEPAGRGHVLYTFDESGQKLTEMGLLSGADREPLAWWCEMAPDGRPRSDTNYAIGIDVGGGNGASNSVMSVVDVATGEKIAEYCNSAPSPHELAAEAVALGRFFGGQRGHAYLCWEQNGPGLIFGKEIRRLGYPFYYWSRKERSAWPKDTDVPGWHSTRTNKELLLGEYRRALAGRNFVNHSEAAVNECFHYVYLPSGLVGPQGGLVEDPSGAKTPHGDRVIADALANKAMSEQPHAAKPLTGIPKGCFADRQAQARRRERRMRW